MVHDESVEGVEALFGQAYGQLESSGGMHNVSLHPFLFSLVCKDVQHLRLCVSDFHSQTWASDFSVEQLQDLRDVMGIGGSWQDFLAYMRAALSSNNVKLMLGGPSNAAGAHGVTSARVVAQKEKGNPRLPLSLTKLEGLDADDARASISVGLFQAFQTLSLGVVSEKERVADLKANLAAEKVKAEKLQEQIDASNLSFASRRKLNRTLSPQLPVAAVVPQHSSLALTQVGTQDVVLPSCSTPLTGSFEDSKKVAVPKPPGIKSRVHVAPASRRTKRRGTAIGERTDT